jgi:hypothetical protein
MRKDAEQRFWSMVLRTPYCWFWIGFRDAKGYGRFQKGCKAHRFAYELFRGPIPKGMVLDHLCLTPACVNPDHLEAVTARENTLRGIAGAAVNYRKTECKRGHPLSGENLYIEPNGRRRICRICDRAKKSRLYREKRKQHL